MFGLSMYNTEVCIKNKVKNNMIKNKYFKFCNSLSSFNDQTSNSNISYSPLILVTFFFGVHWNYEILRIIATGNNRFVK